MTKVFSATTLVLLWVALGQADPKVGSTLIADITRAPSDASQP